MFVCKGTYPYLLSCYKLNYIANNPTRLLTLERSDGGQVKANLARQYEDYKWLYIKGWIKDD